MLKPLKARNADRAIDRVTQFLDEAKTLAKLRHPSIVERALATRSPGNQAKSRLHA